MNLVERIEALFTEHGNRVYQGQRHESVSALQHALQCAQLAEWANAQAPLVAAALLHDMGHFIEAASSSDTLDDVHEMRAVPFLTVAFGPDVVEPVRLHVQAKRYLVATEPAYGASLSAASAQSLTLQGGPMCRDECRLFEDLPYAWDAVALRRWDDQAKQPRKKTPPLAYYLGLLEEVLEVRRGVAVRTVIGAFDG